MTKRKRCIVVESSGRIEDKAADSMQAPAVTGAEAPFSLGGSGDAILQSSDHVQFQVHQLLLKLGSSVFKDMFSIPQPCTSQTSLPVISVTEDASTLRKLLLMLSPEAESLEWTCVEDALKAASACQKYMIPLSRWHLFAQSLWTSEELLRTDPIGWYALAWRVAPDHLNTPYEVLSGDFNAVVALFNLRETRQEESEPILAALRLGKDICFEHTDFELKTLAKYDMDDDMWLGEWRQIREDFKVALNRPNPVCTEALKFIGLEQGMSAGGSGACSCFEKYDGVAATAFLAPLVAKFPKEVKIDQWRPSGPLM